MTKAGERYWPQEQVLPRADNTWTGRVTGIGGEPGNRRTFGLFLVGPDGRALLELWKRTSDQITNFKDYDIRYLTKDITLLQERQVVVISGKPGK
jgi:hypothetical protein